MCWRVVLGVEIATELLVGKAVFVPEDERVGGESMLEGVELAVGLALLGPGSCGFLALARLAAICLAVAMCVCVSFLPLADARGSVPLADTSVLCRLLTRAVLCPGAYFGLRRRGWHTDKAIEGGVRS